MSDYDSREESGLSSDSASASASDQTPHEGPYSTQLHMHDYIQVCQPDSSHTFVLAVCVQCLTQSVAGFLQKFRDPRSIQDWQEAYRELLHERLTTEALSPSDMVTLRGQLTVAECVDVCCLLPPGECHVAGLLQPSELPGIGLRGTLDLDTFYILFNDVRVMRSFHFVLPQNQGCVCAQCACWLFCCNETNSPSTNSRMYGL